MQVDEKKGTKMTADETIKLIDEIAERFREELYELGAPANVAEPAACEYARELLETDDDELDAIAEAYGISPVL